MSKYRVVVVTDRDWWGEAVLEKLSDRDIVLEFADWSVASKLRGTPAALVLDLTPEFDEKQSLVRRWTRAAWQPLCVCWLAPELGAAGVANELEQLGCINVLRGTRQDEQLEELASRVRRILSRGHWIIPRVARALNCYDREAVAALTVAMELIPEDAKVARWADRLGHLRRQELSSLFASCGLPTPKRVLDWLRLIRVVDYARRTRRKMTRDQLADAFGYHDGEYLGKRAKELTGKPLGALIRAGAWEVVVLMSQRT